MQVKLIKSKGYEAYQVIIFLFGKLKETPRGGRLVWFVQTSDFKLVQSTIAVNR